MKINDLYDTMEYATGSIIPIYNRNGIEISFYIGEICDVEIDGMSIIHHPEILPADIRDGITPGYYDREMSMSEEVEKYIVKLINEREEANN